MYALPDDTIRRGREFRGFITLVLVTWLLGWLMGSQRQAAWISSHV